MYQPVDRIPFPKQVLVPPRFRPVSGVSTHRDAVLPFVRLFSPLALWCLTEFYESLPGELENGACSTAVRVVGRCVG